MISIRLAGTLLSEIFCVTYVEALNMHNKISSSSQEKPTVSITDVMCVALSSV